MEMTPYSCMTTEELELEYQKVLSKYEDLKTLGLKLNMARGKPSTAQLDMVSDLLTAMQTAGARRKRSNSCVLPPVMTATSRLVSSTAPS